MSVPVSDPGTAQGAWRSKLIFEHCALDMAARRVMGFSCTTFAGVPRGMGRTPFKACLGISVTMMWLTVWQRWMLPLLQVFHPPLCCPFNHTEPAQNCLLLSRTLCMRN